MASPIIVRQFRNVLSPSGKTPIGKRLNSLVSNVIPKREPKFENILFEPNEYEVSVSPLKSLIKTSPLLLDTHTNVQKELLKTPIREKIYYNDQSENIPSVDTPEQKKWLDKGLESFSSWNILGKGGFGTVVKAKYRGKNLAVKIVPKTSKYFSSSLKKEQNAIKLRHENIIQVFKVVNMDTNYGLVLMEKWYQMNLQTLINDDALINIEQKLRILWNIGEALQHCHRNSILHLDLKPKNILVRLSDVTCKLCDFGSSLNTDVPDDDSCLILPRGTIQYISPELLQGRDATEKSDVYSMAITMWQLLYEEIPYLGENIYVIAYKVVSQNYRPKTMKEMQNNKLVALYESCWQSNPLDRPCMSQFVQQIKQYIHF